MKIALIGDIGFFGKHSLRTNENIYEYFEDVKKHLEQFDYVVGNLELPFLEKGKPFGAKSVNIKSDPENVELLKHLNINVVTLANNHMFDFGQQGVDSTIELLEKNKIQYFGVNNKDLVLDDAKLALHGYCCYSTNPYGLGVIGKLNASEVEYKIKQYHKDGYLNLVSIHAGLEHINYPAYHDILMARQWSELCPLIYHGHHPHVLQGVECLNNSLLAYSLGNFCFDDVYTSNSDKPLVELSENNKTSVIIGLEVENGNLLSYEMAGIYMGKDKLEIGDSEISTAIDGYASAFNDNESVYTENRNNLFSEYISTRKSVRDISWYLKRLNIKSVKMIARSLYNARQHKKNVINYTAAKNKYV